MNKNQCNHYEYCSAPLCPLDEESLEHAQRRIDSQLVSFKLCQDTGDWPDPSIATRVLSRVRRD